MVGAQGEIIGRVVPQLMRRYRVPGCAVGTAADGGLSWSEGFGTADERRGVAVDTTTTFQVASLSKIVTAWTAMTLVADGRIGLDDPIGPYLKQWDYPRTDEARLVTLRGLLSHTAGLPSAASEVYSSAADVPSILDVVRGRAGTPAAVPDRRPGKAFRYSNPGYALVQLLVDDVTGTPFAAYARQRVLVPLGMSASTFDPATAAAAPHRRSGQRLPDGWVNQQAAGGLVTTVGDLGRLCVAMMSTDNRVLPPEAVRAMSDSPPAGRGAFRLRDGGYALGHVSGLLPNGTRFVANQGSRPGWRAILLCLPERLQAIVVVTNADSGMPLVLHLALRWLRRVASEPLPRLRII